MTRSRKTTAHAAVEDERIGRFRTVVAAATSPATTRIAVAALQVALAGGTREVEPARIAQEAGLEGGDQDRDERLRTANEAFRDAFGVRIFRTDTIGPTWVAAEGADANAKRREVPQPLVLSANFADLLRDREALDVSGEAPVPDDATTTWVGAIRSAVAAGETLHLALRCRRDDAGEIETLGRLLARSGMRVVVLPRAPLDVETELLAMQVQAAAPAVVLIGEDVLVQVDTERPWYETDAPEGPERLRLAPLSARIGGWLPRLAGVHVWRTPAHGRLEPATCGPIGACMGPIGADPAWTRATVAAIVPGIGAAGVAALARDLVDPRDASAMATAARHLATGGSLDVDAACALVAGSFARRAATPAAARPTPPALFDRRLLSCDPDALELLDRADAAMRNGARVLAWGPPGSGKSTYVQELACRMAASLRPAAEVITVTAATILARQWGATERLVEGLWSRAAGDGTTPAGILVIDEIDALCGVRDPYGSSSGNAYLVRTLTDLWLRCFDLHPHVPVLATVNDPLAVDAGVRRRFAMVTEFRDELTPEGERAAWSIILNTEPPPGWTPCGAAVADVATAALRVRILGPVTTAAMAAAVIAARASRLGPVAHRRPTARPPGRIH